MLMKKITLLMTGILLSSLAAMAQAPRMQLFEEFSGENCGPCAQVNPYVHSLSVANEDKMILLKYQVPIPSAGPLYTGTPAKPDVDIRDSYYNISSAPTGIQDGKIYNGHPASFTQTMINNRASVTSPVSIDLGHTLNPAKDTIIVTMTITALSDVNGIDKLKARMAVVEDEMVFTTAPGSNGEKVFHHVVKKMLPNGTGLNVLSNTINFLTPVKNILATPPTSPAANDRYIVNTAATGAWTGEDGKIAQWDGTQWTFTAATTNDVVKLTTGNTYRQYNGTTWATFTKALMAGDQVTFVEKWKLANIYDMAEVSVIAFVQDDTDKLVHQSAKTTPIPLPLDAALPKLVGGDFMKCATTFNPVVTVKNIGSVTMTSAYIIYKLDSNPADTLVITDTLATGESKDYTISNIGIAPGTHTLTTRVDYPNGATDTRQKNNSQSFKFYVVGSYTAAPHFNDFQASVFPGPAVVNNVSANAYTWEKRNATKAGGFGQSNACAKINFYSNNSGDVDELIVQPLDLSSFTTVGNLEFSIAHAQYTTAYVDKLQVKVSVDCGQNWDIIYSKQGAALATVAPTTSAYTATAAQWRREIVDLVDYFGVSEVLMKFVATSGNGNNLYLDDVNVNNFALGTDKPGLEAEKTFSVYPNPAKDQVNVQLANNAKGSVINLINMQGQLVKTLEVSANTLSVSIPVTELAEGLYTYQVAEEGVLKHSGKLTVIK